MFKVTRSLTRFRILNGSNTRWYNLAFKDNRPFRLIATHSGYVGEEPPELTSLLMSPGERAEIIVEFHHGDDVLLQNISESKWPLEDYGTNVDFNVIRFVTDSELEQSGEISLPALESLTDESASDNRRSYTLNGHSEINGKEIAMSRIDEVVPAGAVEIWEVTTSRFATHNSHILGVSFEVIDIDGEETPLHQRGSKDTVKVPRDKTVTMRVQFPEYTDETYPFMYHCHILRHEDEGMMGQFLVVASGRENDASRRIDSGHTAHE